MQDLLTRGVSNVIPDKNKLEKILGSNKKLNVYIGIDPTAIKIHLGHALPLRKLQAFADLGHHVTFLIGDFTALIGDNSDKDSERPVLTQKEIEENFKTYKEQAQKILDFSKIKVRHNSEWLSKLSFEEIVKLTQNFSVGDFVSRELVKKRLNDGKRVGLHEFLYPVMQGYDSYFMNTDVQIGGVDQVFNMQAGRTLLKNLKDKDSFILCTDYLMGTDGRKMSKSWGNAVWLTDEPFEMYRKIMAINDNQIRNYYLLASSIPEKNIPNEEEISKNPMITKKKLAEAIVKELHSEEQARKATEEFERVVQNKELPENVSEIFVDKEKTIDENFLVEKGFASSKSESKRLFDQNGVSLDGQKIKSGESLMNTASKEPILKIGKHVVKLKING